MDKIPVKIKKCPIKEAILEVRFEPNPPTDAVFGILYSSVKDLFPNSKPRQLQTAQIPEYIRMKDDNLRYQPLNRLEEGNLSLGIGSNTIVFGNTGEYLGWENWSFFFTKILQNIKNTDVFKEVNRIGLRYINVFDESIFENANINLSLSDRKLVSETSNLRTELIDPNFVKILQIGNNVNLVTNGKTQNCSVIDIDCIYKSKIDNFYDEYRDIVNSAHKKEKELFFSLLKDNFVEKLDPVWE